MSDSDSECVLLSRLRSLTQNCITNNQLSGARFFADKCCSVSSEADADVYLLSKVFYLKKEFHRCIHLLQTHNLIPHPNEMGIDDCSFYQQFIHKHNQQQPQSQSRSSPPTPNNDDNNNNDNDNNNLNCTDLLSYLLLGMQAFVGCGEYESAIMILGNSDENAMNVIQLRKKPMFFSAEDVICDKQSQNQNATDNNHHNQSPQTQNQTQTSKINIASLICLTRAKALEKLQNDIRAREWFKQALIFDAKNIQAFDCIVNRRLETGANLRQFVSELDFDVSFDWLRFYYNSKIDEISCEQSAIERMNIELEANYHPILSNSDDMKIIAANCSTNLHLYRNSYDITKQILSQNPYNISALTSHIICMTELGNQSELYKHSHNLICAYPSSAISWFAVGCYYYLTRRHEIARKFLSKATAIDNFFVPAWIVFGHTFAEQDADEQSIAAYRMAHRLFPEAHQPLLFIGIGYLNMNNLLYAEKFLRQSYLKCAHEPLVFNELGVVCYQHKFYHKAIDFFHTAIKYISPDCYNIWESTFFNLAHCYRKLKRFDDALECYTTALNISPRDPQILSAIAFTLHLQNELSKAIDYYHSVLAISPHDTFANQMLHRAIQQESQTSLHKQTLIFGGAGDGERGI